MKMTMNLLAACALAAASMAHAAAPSLQPSFDLRVLDEPHAAATDAGTQVFEELHLTNFTDSPLRLIDVAVVDARGGQVLAHFDGEALTRRLARIGTPATSGDATVPSGSRAVVYMEWPANAHRPRAVEHVVTYAPPHGAPAYVVRGARTAVSYAAGAPLGPPLRGGPWVAVHAASWARGHRRVFNAVDGQARIPARFAIDWIRVDDAGHTARQHPDIPSNWLGYGVDVLAVADATVVTVRDDMTESPRVSTNPRHALADDAGNFVTIRLTDGRYAFYEHLRPGSTAVHVGDRVHRGEVLAQLGFTGASTGPHLHFHVADEPSRVSAEGRPFTLAAFDLLGRYDDIAALGNAPWAQRAAGESEQRHDEWPAENAVVRFPD
ncbi:M23 family metallopeptidase [Dyella sp.]|uniref:M23 family metallopeptidase n=1 Tax=Dyella sp. TaxID=1869338 RepID=UPI003F81F06C